MSLDSYVPTADELKSLRITKQIIHDGFFQTAQFNIPPNPEKRHYRIQMIYRLLAITYNSGDREAKDKRWIYKELLKLLGAECRIAKKEFIAPVETTIFRDLNYSSDKDWEGFQTDSFFWRLENNEKKIIPATICETAGKYKVNPALIDQISQEKLI